MENINKIKKIIQNTLIMESTMPYGSELFSQYFNQFDFEFIDYYFSAKKGKLLKRSFYSKFTTINNLNHYVNYLVYKNKHIDNWFDLKFSNLSILNLHQSFLSIRESLIKADNYKEFEDSLLNSIILKFKQHSHHGSKMKNNDYNICNSIIYNFCLIAYDENIKINSNIKNELFKIFNEYVQEHPIATLNQACYKGINITKKQIRYLNDEEQHIPKKTINMSSMYILDLDVLEKHAAFNKYISISVKNREQYDIWKSMEFKFIDNYIVEKNNIINLKKNIENEVKHLNKFNSIQKILFNDLFKSMDDESVFKLLSNIKLSSNDLDFNRNLIRDIVQYVDNYGNLNDEYLELLKISYSI